MTDKLPKTPPGENATVETGRRRLMILAILPAIAAFDAFANSVMGTFVLDDSNAILKNETIRNLWDISTVVQPPPESTVEGRPVINFTLALNYAMGGLHSVGYHIFNLLVHMSASLVLFGVIRRTLVRPVMPECFRKASAELACIIATLWAVHPIQTQSVTYVIQRCESLMGLMYLLSLYSLIRMADERNSRPWLWQSLTIAACGAGMFCKEVMVTAPVILLLYDRTFLAGSLTDVFQKRWKVYIGLAMTWGLLAVSLMQSHMRDNQFQYTASPVVYAMNEAGVIMHYLRQVFWPTGLSLVYYWPVADFSLSMLPGIITVLILLAATITGLIRNKPWSFLGACFFGILSPTSSFVPQVHLAFEHRMYLPLAAVVALTVLVIYRAGEYFLSASSDEYRRTVRRLAISAVAIICTALIVLTISRNYDYRSLLSIWSDTVAKQPACAVARLGLANALIDEGRNLEAVQVIQEALRVQPNYREGLACLGYAYMELGNYNKALEEFEKAIEYHPDYYLAYYNRGAIHYRRGEYKQAIDDFEEALSLRPGYENAVRDIEKIREYLAEHPEDASSRSGKR